jgi:6-phosphofructokinase 2
MAILTLTINPVIDKSTTVERLIAEQKMRVPNPILAAGGGGINVSRGIQELGGQSKILCQSGGANGAILQQLLTAKKLDFEVIETIAATRESFIVTDISTNHQYRFNSVGESISEKEGQLFLKKIEQIRPEWLVASGSLPPGLGDNFYEKIAHVANKIGSKFILDTSGEPLRQAADEGVFLLKPNLPELCALSGVENLELDDVDDAARNIILSGKCQVVVVSLGPAGAMLVTRDSEEMISAPTVKKLSTVGAGDSMVAGMVWALKNGQNFSEMVRWGVACGSAATMNPGAELFKKADAFRLFEWISKKKN